MDQEDHETFLVRFEHVLGHLLLVVVVVVHGAVGRVDLGREKGLLAERVEFELVQDFETFLFLLSQ